MYRLATNQAVGGSSRAPQARDNVVAQRRRPRRGEAAGRIIVPGAPFYYLKQAITAFRVVGFFVAVQ